MSDQPMPSQQGGEPVTPVARALFLEMLAAREAKGIATYGRSLHTQNGRDPIQDALEELIDGWQYLVQIRMERERLHAALRRWLEMWEMSGATLRDYVDASFELAAVAREVLNA